MIKNKLSVLSFVLVFILILSGLVATPVYADEAPPQEQAEETAPQESAEEEASPPTTGETDTAPSESGLTNESPILEQLPENTQIIVTNETGEPIPLATQEAQEAIKFIDPMWCPVGVKPKANTGGCTAGYPNLFALINDIATNMIAEPTKAGVIWIETGADGSAANIVIDGSDPDLGSWSNFALTLQGGWNGVDLSTTIVGPSTFTKSISVINWNAPVTINNITISGTTATNGLEVVTTGNIVVSNVISQNNSGRGAYLDNSAGTGNVTVTSSQFNSNSGVHGISINSKGSVTLKDVSANSNLNGYGAVISNDSATTPKPVTLSGVNSFSGNGANVGFSGLVINSIGSVTISNLIASNNGKTAVFGYGAEIYNDTAPVPSGVTLTGTNIFSDNISGGLYIATVGAVKASNLYANSNNHIGVEINNASATAPQSVTITGTNEFKYNIVFGLSITSKGVITLNNIIANANGQTGVSITNSGPATSSVNITGTNQFNLNGNSGLAIQYSVTGGAVTLNNITANGNGTSLSGYGISIINNVGTTFKGVTLTGTNTFTGNYDSGINIVTSGPIILNNITQSGTLSGRGVLLNSAPSGPTKPQAVVINGLNNTFNNNNADGLYINTFGTVTLNNITANNNGLGMSIGTGLYVTNDGSDKPQNVTIKGNNSFINNYETGLYIVSKGAVLTNSITASGNDGYGVLIANHFGTANVTMSGNNLFTGNQADNLYIQSAGVITLNNITSNASVTGKGANVSNSPSATAKNITLTGTNTFNNNDDEGLQIIAKGIITVNNLNASGNGLGSSSSGVYLFNIFSPTNAGVNVNGTNTFNSNAGNGLLIWTLGNVKTNAISASSNNQIGFEVYGAFAPNTGNVTMTGNNTFSTNMGGGLQINAYGVVTLNNISATGSSSGNGVYIMNTYGGNAVQKNVTLTGTNVMSNNNSVGLIISTFGAVVTNNLTINNNSNVGLSVQNNGGVKPMGVTLNGTNKFNNNGSDNVNIASDGLIKINNLTSTNASNMGAALSNSTGTAGVTLTGTNYFDSNTNAGLFISSAGVITLSNITSTNSSDMGAQILNNGSGFASPKNVTLTGTNNFSGNALTGLEIRTYGSVTINNLSANNNGSAMNMTYGEGVDIVNYHGNNTIAANVTLTGNNTFNGNYTEGLHIITYGAIKTNNLTANNNGLTTNRHGIRLDNINALSNAYSITLTGNNTFDNNGNNGLRVESKGTVTLNNLTAAENATFGLYVDNTYAGANTPKPVTISGTNNFSDNNSGFYINSHGVVTLSKVTASNSVAGSGGVISNNLTNVPANVTITGYGIFNNNNTGNGLLIISKGAVTLTNITTIGNTFSGLDVNNSTGTGNVTITGTNTFTDNGDNGATISSNGNVSITKITADDNGQSGLVIVTSKTVTLTCGSLTLNTQYGWEVYNATSVTLKGVFTAANGSGDYMTASPLAISRACPLP
ncbi:MAG: hypothetical protein KF758_01235 [Anaerolineales bacterium]|nr:hypothetical protein [Anaerolineales bacterium]